MSAYEIATLAAQGYAGLGLLVALGYLLVGGPQVDPSVKGSSIFFRLLVLPAATMLWPAVLARWIRGFGPAESPSHEEGARP